MQILLESTATMKYVFCWRQSCKRTSQETEVLFFLFFKVHWVSPLLWFMTVKNVFCSSRWLEQSLHVSKNRNKPVNTLQGTTATITQILEMSQGFQSKLVTTRVDILWTVKLLVTLVLYNNQFRTSKITRHRCLWVLIPTSNILKSLVWTLENEHLMWHQSTQRKHFSPLSGKLGEYYT